MIVVLGLGNPGKKFEKTWHNLGFLVLDKIAKEYFFPTFKFEKKFLAEISRGKIEKKEIVLAKPKTFVNLSGKSAKKLVSYLKLKMENFFVVHDDLDIPFGKIKIAKGRGSAGHKGIQSIIDELKTKDFVRFRIGIKPRNNWTKNKKEDFVLQKFSKKEEKILKKVIKKTSQAIKIAIKEGIEKAINEFNK
jgi:PTH1 family peptidyl-tRNA hydrolase